MGQGLRSEPFSFSMSTKSDDVRCTPHARSAGVRRRRRSHGVLASEHARNHVPVWRLVSCRDGPTGRGDVRCRRSLRERRCDDERHGRCLARVAPRRRERAPLARDVRRGVRPARVHRLARRPDCEAGLRRVRAEVSRLRGRRVRLEPRASLASELRRGRIIRAAVRRPPARGHARARAVARRAQLRAGQPGVLADPGRGRRGCARSGRRRGRTGGRAKRRSRLRAAYSATSARRPSGASGSPLRT